MHSRHKCLSVFRLRRPDTQDEGKALVNRGDCIFSSHRLSSHDDRDRELGEVWGEFHYYNAFFFQSYTSKARDPLLFTADVYSHLVL